MPILGSPLFSGGFMPHEYCYLVSPSLIVLHAISDWLIAYSWLSIPIPLPHFTRNRNGIPFRWMFLCFGAFIAAPPAPRWEKLP
jgi:two-component system, NtrC family, sensor kinase